MVPVNVPGLSKKRLNELDPFNYRDLDEMKKLVLDLLQHQNIFIEHELNVIEIAIELIQ